MARYSEEGDAAMEAGDFDRAYEIYAASKAARDALLPAVEGPGDMVLPSGGTSEDNAATGERIAVNFGPFHRRPSAN